MSDMTLLIGIIVAVAISQAAAFRLGMWYENERWKHDLLLAGLACISKASGTFQVLCQKCYPNELPGEMTAETRHKEMVFDLPLCKRCHNPLVGASERSIGLCFCCIRHDLTHVSEIPTA